MKSILSLSLSMIAVCGFALADKEKATPTPAAQKATTPPAAHKNLLLIAGTKSHGYGSHEHNAGVLLFKKCQHLRIIIFFISFEDLIVD
ncbi:MAG: hypothetical protein ACO3SO_12620, partial [Luteolibacter sp.]